MFTFPSSVIVYIGFLSLLAVIRPAGQDLPRIQLISLAVLQDLSLLLQYVDAALATLYPEKFPGQ